MKKKVFSSISLIKFILEYKYCNKYATSINIFIK